MTPLQKSIAEIEAEIKQGEKDILYFKSKGLEYAPEHRHHVSLGLRRALVILTANLEYERDVIVQAWTDGTYGIGDNAHDYYTKTYENK